MMLQPEGTFEITVNGQKSETSAATLAEFVAEQDMTTARIATALNGHFVAADRRATTALKAGDRIEIVSPRQGG